MPVGFNSVQAGVPPNPLAYVRTQASLKPIPLASGGTVQASHYNLSGSFNVDVWYDQMNTWAGLAFTVADGSDVHYERL